MSPLLESLLTAVNEPDPGSGETTLLDAFDWTASEVAVPYIVFFTGRCGSTWLTSLIRDTGLAGNPEEFLNGDVARYSGIENPQGLQDYFSRIVAKEKSNGRFGLEIDAERLAGVSKAVSFPSVFPRRVTKTFYMYRRDIVAQAWSWAAARKSGVWHLPATGTTGAPATGALPSTLDLAREIIRIRVNEELLGEFFVRNEYAPVFVEYENLVTDPNSVLFLMLSVLGVSATEISAKCAHGAGDGATKRLAYDDKYSVILRLYDQHPDLARRLSGERTSISSSELKLMLFP